MRAYCLSFHAAYRCAHSGACCTAGWPIPVDEALLPVLRAPALLQYTARSPVRFLDTPVNGSRTALPTTGDGTCVFFEATRGRLCAIHREAGERNLPASCRTFPRIALRDARGIFITLSHYCPTAARLLLDAGPIRVVDAPSSLTLDGAVEGLDATGVLPPLLRPGMLMDMEGYAAWEHQALRTLDDPHYTARDAVRIIRAATGDACTWHPGGETLATRIDTAFGGARSAAAPSPSFAVGRLEHAIKAFLAGHLFGSWAAYRRGGLTAVCDGVEATLALIGSNVAGDAGFLVAVRNADLLLRHRITSPFPAPAPPRDPVGRSGEIQSA